tara:strand:- start:847 stop:1362 length:516 start_codon:yes stop_codon:yes gene_type:complete
MITIDSNFLLSLDSEIHSDFVDDLLVLASIKTNKLLKIKRIFDDGRLMYYKNEEYIKTLIDDLNKASFEYDKKDCLPLWWLKSEQNNYVDTAYNDYLSISSEHSLSKTRYKKILINDSCINFNLFCRVLSILYIDATLMMDYNQLYSSDLRQKRRYILFTFNEQNYGRLPF